MKRVVQMGTICISTPDASEFDILTVWDGAHLAPESNVFTGIHAQVKKALMENDSTLFKAKLEVSLAQAEATVLKRYG
ncbi:hypothetical protein SKAU_G00194350 [Synaphobranchus kaupii]|uniref:Uncharacterized protein n=1 Tax=Synaphobranchus kaupii TaxID=118154 RepID=A0A9Q1FE49_SYNKA|nr:hypothetical protein SKAU_G00194350 [Synaphobranchus kaupii]